MSYNEVFEKVAGLIEMQLPVSRDKIKPESKLIEDLGAGKGYEHVPLGCCDGEFHVVISDIGEDEDIAGMHLDLESSVQVGRGSLRGIAFHEHACAHSRVSCRVYDSTAYLDILRKQHRSAEKREDQ